MRRLLYFIMNRPITLGLTARFSLVLGIAMVPLAVGFAVDEGAFTVALGASLLLSIGIGTAGVLFVVRRVDRSLSRLERATIRLAAGDLSTRVYPSRIPQLSGLSRGLNAMASQLQERVEALLRLSSEQDAILRNMIEGVVTVDRDGKIVRVNDAAISLLDITNLPCDGRLVAEVIRHAEVQQFIRSSIGSGEARTETIHVVLPEERFLEVYSCPIQIGDSDAPGTLLVFHDVTRVRRLERVRRDFVANVSHELRTPITSIKGYVETLRDGAAEEPELRTNFLGVIARHADRLNAIVTDLLTLARLEGEGDGAAVELSVVNIRDVLHSAFESCMAHAEGKGLSLKLDPGDRRLVEANASLLEQAVVNIVDNAIKHTDAGGTIRIGTQVQGQFVRIDVKDTGCGIEQAHLSRLFERFYRVDVGRSRKVGGTGLGLAIVKHIMQVHGGRVDVVSTPGRGSTFSLYLRAIQ